MAWVAVTPVIISYRNKYCLREISGNMPDIFYLIMLKILT